MTMKRWGWDLNLDPLTLESLGLNALRPDAIA